MQSSASHGARPRFTSTGYDSSLETKVGKQYDNNGSSKFLQDGDRGLSLDKVAQSVATVAQMGYPRTLVEHVAQRLLSVNGSKPPTCRQLAEAVQNIDEVTNSPQCATFSEDAPSAVAAGGSSKARMSDTQSQKSIAAELPSKNHLASLAQLIRDVERETDEQDSVATAAAIVEHLTCKVCREQRSHVVLLPCGHLCCCGSCAASVRTCPMCGSDVRGAIKAYLS